MLVLSHYRNKIVPWFFLEGLWACALYSFGERVDEGVCDVSVSLSLSVCVCVCVCVCLCSILRLLRIYN